MRSSFKSLLFRHSSFWAAALGLIALTPCRANPIVSITLGGQVYQVTSVVENVGDTWYYDNGYNNPWSVQQPDNDFAADAALAESAADQAGAALTNGRNPDGPLFVYGIDSHDGTYYAAAYNFASGEAVLVTGSYDTTTNLALLYYPPSPPQGQASVPDTGSAWVLLGLGLAAVFGLHRKQSHAKFAA